MGNKVRTKMSRENRAKQFLPFAALKGFEEALVKKERIVVDKVELSEDMAEELNLRLVTLKKGMMATIVHYDKAECEYIKTTGVVAGIDMSCKQIRIVNTKIDIDDIYDLIIH